MNKKPPLAGQTYYDSEANQLITVYQVLGHTVHFVVTGDPKNVGWFTLPWFEEYCYTLSELQEILREYKALKEGREQP